MEGMNAKEITDSMINLQDRMFKLQEIEANANKKKIEAEQEIRDCNHAWYALYSEYQKCREKLNALNK